MHLDYIIGNFSTGFHGLVRSYADEPSTTGVIATDGSDWNQSELLSYVNAEHKHLFSIVRNLYEDWFMRFQIFPLVDNVFRYLLNRDCINPRRVEFINSSGVSGSPLDYIVDEVAAEPEEVQEVEISGKDNLRHYTSSNRVVRTNGYYLFDDIIQFLPDSRVGPNFFSRIYYLPSSVDLHRSIAQAGSANTITLGLNTDSQTLGFIYPIDNYYQNSFIEIIKGTGAGQINKIKFYEGSTRIATMWNNWSIVPDATSIYSIVSPIKDDFHELLALGAVMRAKGIKVEDDTNTVAQMYGAVLSQMINSLERRSHQVPRRVISTQRSGVWY